jgi:beta-lactamase regulating signal transducer with metallopeptidase domain
MIALLVFSLIAAGTVWFAGRKDQALDPRLTTVVLLLLALFPILVQAIPKIAVLPVAELGDHRWAALLLTVWSIGFLVSLIRLLRVSRRITRWREASECIGKIGDVEFRQLGGIRGPMAAGIFRKIVFLPADWDDWDETKREWALAHELAHHRRKDPLRRWIAGFAVAANWFNPLVGWMVKRLLIQCEFACDESVLKQGAKRESYAGLLCDLAEEKSLDDPVLAMAERSGLEARVRRIMRNPAAGEEMATSWLILFAVAMAGLLAILGAEQIAGYTQGEILLRRTADQFPGN